jgi:hypothetical protein
MSRSADPGDSNGLLDRIPDLGMPDMDPRGRREKGEQKENLSIATAHQSHKTVSLVL